MLERAAGCVETAGRRFLRDPNGAIRTRRALPRYFWKHNGAATDVAQCLRALVPPSGQSRSFVHNQLPETKPVNDGGPPFLDFLYPRETRQSAALRLPRHPKRLLSRRRKRTLPSLSRTYTSGASTLQQILLGEEDTRTQAAPDPTDVRRQALHDLTKLLEQKGVDYDRAWVLYIAAGCPPDSHFDIRSALCAYLSNSGKPADQDRAWQVFESITPEIRSADDFHNILRSQTRANNSLRLKSICQKAIAKGYADPCCAFSFAYHVKRNNWSDALEIWDLRWRAEEQPKGPQPQTFLSELKDSMIPENALSLGTFLASQSGHLGAIELAKFLLGHTLTSLHVLESTSVGVLIQLLRKYHELEVLDRNHFFDCIKTLQGSKQRQIFAWSIVIYRHLRSQMPDVEPPKALLARQVDNLVSLEMTDAIPFFLDEIAHFYRKPSPEVYKQAMVAFSRVGDATQVNSVFDRLVADHGKPRSRRFLTPLLFVHARSGNVQKTHVQFQRISDEFHLKPSVACWNVLLVAYAVSKDPAGALLTFSQMRASGAQPDSYTFAKLMSICAQRGDIASVRELLKQAQKSQVRITMQVLEKVSQVYANAGLLNLAEEFAMVCLHSKVEGSPMRMLNGLLKQYAFRIDTQSFKRVLSCMKSNGLSPDASTHAAIILHLALIGKPDQARMTLRRLHKKRIMHASEYHYAIVLWGYVKSRNLAMVDVISREIAQRFGKPGTVSNFEGLKSEVQRDLEKSKQDSPTADPDNYLRGVETKLLGSIATFDTVSETTDSSRASLGQRSDSGALNASHYGYLIKEYGTKGAIEQARALFQEYLDSRSSRGLPADGYESVPIRLVSEMMYAHMKSGQYERVKECWHILLPSAVKMASRIDLGPLLQSQPSISNVSSEAASSPSSSLDRLPSSRGSLVGSRSGDSSPHQKPEILHSQRFILSRPFSLYLRALAYENNTENIYKAVAEYKAIGFSLSTFNASTLVQMLSSSDKYDDLVEAFRIFELEFMPHWPGWARLERGSGFKPPGTPKGIAALDDPRTKRSSQNFLGRNARRYWSSIAPGFMQPTYVSMVYLAAALNRVRTTSIVNGGQELAKLFEIAPDTIEELGKLRYMREKFQGVLVRFRSQQPEKEPRRRTAHYAVAPGILGSSRQAKSRRRVYDEEQLEMEGEDASHNSENQESSELQEETLAKTKVTLPTEDTEWNTLLGRDGPHLDILESALTPEDRMDLENEMTRYHRQRREKRSRRDKRHRPKKPQSRDTEVRVEELHESTDHAEVHEAQHEEISTEVLETPKDETH